MSRIKVDRITDKAGTGAPTLVNGINVTGKSTMGDIVGAAATFNSITAGGDVTFGANVSIGGTLTYEDVKNVDSVGLITARTGIKVTAGGIDVTAGGITVAAGGINVTGDSTFAGAINANGVLSIAGGADGTLQELRLAQGNDVSKRATIKGHSANTNEKGIQFNTFHYTPKIPIKLASTGAIGLGGDNYGTTGQVLTSQGSGAVAQWADAGGGIWETISYNTNITGVSEIVSNGWNFSRYSQIRIIGCQFISGFNNFEFRARCYVTPQGGSESLATSDYYAKYSMLRINYVNAASFNERSGSVWQFGNAESAETWDFDFVYNVNNNTTGSFAGLKMLIGNSQYYKAAQIWNNKELWSHQWQAGANISGIKLYTSSGANFTNGRLHIIGLVAGS